MFSNLTLTASIRGRVVPLTKGLLLPLFLTIVHPLSAWAKGTPPDIVKLNNGGVIRGTIIESIPGQSVRIQLVDGSIREFAADVVKYVGADEPQRSEDSPASEPLPVQHVPDENAVTKNIRLKLLSAQPGSTFGIETSNSDWAASGVAFTTAGVAPVAAAGRSVHFQRLCTAPCVTELLPGSYVLDLTQEDGRNAKSRRLTIPSDGTLYGQYISHSGTRSVGWLLMIAGSIAGTVLMLRTRETNCEQFLDSEFCDEEYPTFVPGLLVLGGSLVGGGFMARKADQAKMDFVPSGR